MVCPCLGSTDEEVYRQVYRSRQFDQGSSCGSGTRPVAVVGGGAGREPADLQTLCAEAASQGSATGKVGRPQRRVYQVDPLGVAERRLGTAAALRRYGCQETKDALVPGLHHRVDEEAT